MNELLIAHRIPPNVTPLRQWLAEVASRTNVLTSKEIYPHYAGDFAGTHAIPDYLDDIAFEQTVAEIVRHHPITKLIHVTEDDILRCAQARDRYDLPGLRYIDALPWRDKYHMKRFVRWTGVPTPEFAAPSSIVDAEVFARRVGYPVVVKPRLGFASRGVKVVHDSAGLREAASAWDVDDVLIESYTPGFVYHVDGFMHDGKPLYVSVSRYLNDCMAFHDGLPLGSVQLDRDSENFQRVARFAEEVIPALPPVDFSPFHLEVFHTPDDELVFCEIACRLGGAHIMESLTYATGVNPAQLWIRHQAGLVDGRTVAVKDRGNRYGWLLVPPKTGVLTGIDEPTGYPFIKDFIVKAPIGKRFDGAHASTDSFVAFVVEGTDSADLERNIRFCSELSNTLGRWAT
ncbi:ATP-grasp domain-containing protein [Actinocrispum wychmicini]|uniref:ATP-grasp domain-containing protein n=1 Tax=Actinocrispum wychmicini TaxID=1213861 RepID=UPI00104D43FC|nr:ATP-grasp domain-containing protein [Actinocrispum wychmicini]